MLARIVSCNSVTSGLIYLSFDYFLRLRPTSNQRFYKDYSYNVQRFYHYVGFMNCIIRKPVFRVSVPTRHDLSCLPWTYSTKSNKSEFLTKSNNDGAVHLQKMTSGLDK